jgi:putative oxidoreductase
MYLDASWLDTAGRLLIVFFFLAAGIANLTPARIKDHIDRMAIYRTPFPTAAFWFGIAIQFIGCLLLLIGWHAEIGVYCLMLFTVAATAIFHRFWSKTDPMQRNISRITLLSNSALFGALLLLLQNVR